MFNHKKLKEIREAHDMSQKEVAKLFNIAASTLSNYERGTRRPSHEFLISYSEVFNIPKDELLAALYDESVNDGLDDYNATKVDFVFLDPERMLELSLSELVAIKDYAEYIYSKRRKGKGKRRW